MGRRHRFAASTAAVAIAFSAPSIAIAQEQTYAFDIPAQDLGSALRAFAKATRQQISFSGEMVRGKRSNALKGSYSANAGLETLLRDSGLTTRTAERGVLILTPVGDRSELLPRGEGGAASVAAELGDAVSVDPVVQEIVVTGTHIRGGQSASPLIQITDQEIKEGGFNDIGDVVRSIPQNFNGGQNPSVVNGGNNLQNGNYTSASSVNLRGLGPDATLTLLDGRRLSYNGFVQAVDVSTIPLHLVDRIEILPDGASAIYGSDAVGGVVNIIPKKRFDGVHTAARLALPTNGGGIQQKYSLSLGHSFAHGGLFAGYQVSRDEAILAADRDYLSYMFDPQTIIPRIVGNNLFLRANHNTPGGTEFVLDAFYNDRDSRVIRSDESNQYQFDISSESLFFSPGLVSDIGAGWQIRAYGVYGIDDSDQKSEFFTRSGQRTFSSTQCYCNSAQSLEASAEGPLFSLPGGRSRLVLGGGIRRNAFQVLADGDETSLDSQKGARSSYFTYAELYVPAISPEQEIAGANSLFFTGALRYESHDNIGDIVTPKLGLVYSPFDGLKLQASLGRSFKAPTLQQTSSITTANILPAVFFGGAEYPATASGIFIVGGGPLRPERAKTASFTASFQPRSVPDLVIEGSAFHISYKDRVVRPIISFESALTTPEYAQFVTLNPSLNEIDSALELTDIVFNIIPGPFNANDVVAVIDNRFTNVAHQRVSGLDFQASYVVPLGGGRLRLSGSSSYITSSQANTKGAPFFKLAGTAFNPPKWRGRAGLTWNDEATTIASFVNYIGGVKTPGETIKHEGGSMISADMTISHTMPASGAFSGIDVSLIVQNIFNERPPLFTVNHPSQVAYDSTNYTPVGRVISLSISKTW